MPWHEKNTRQTPLENTPIPGLYHLDGDLLAQRYLQDWIKQHKYPTITFPSGLARELWDSPDGGGFVNIFGTFELLRHSTRDEGFQHAREFATTYGYTLARRGDSELVVLHPISGRGYIITYDNQQRTLINVTRTPVEAMELLDIESRAVLPDLYSSEKSGLNAIAPVKFFTPDSHWTWYASEYDGEDTFFGLVSGFEVELGYFSLTELEEVRGGLGLPVERDLYFAPQPLHNLLQQHRP